MAEIVLTIEEIEEFFLRALCNGLSYTTSGYGLDLNWEPKEYQTAKETLKQVTMSDPEGEICFEDVLMQILRAGGSLTLVDVEGDEDPATIILKDIHDRMPKVGIKILYQMLHEEDDAGTADIIIQTVFLGEVIYG